MIWPDIPTRGRGRAFMFISFDGVDGVGKSTQIRLFCQSLEKQGSAVVTCRDPGSTSLGEQVRNLVLDEKGLRIDRRSEMLLYMAARAQLVDEVIRPSLESGQIVVSDRFLLANVVYQAHAGGLPVDDVWTVGRVATGNLMPDMTILLDMDVDKALARLEREHDRMESQGVEYLRKVRDGFLVEASKAPQTIKVIDASQSIEAIQAEIVRHFVDLSN